MFGGGAGRSAIDETADPAGGRPVRPTHAEHPGGLWGVGGDQSGPNRLLDNEAVEWRALLAAHGKSTVGREARVLCLQDTTELDFTSQPGIAGLGRLSYERQHGMYLHPTLAVSEGGVALGVLDAWM